MCMRYGWIETFVRVRVCVGDNGRSEVTGGQPIRHRLTLRNRLSSWPTMGVGMVLKVGRLKESSTSCRRRRTEITEGVEGLSPPQHGGVWEFF